MRKTKIERKTNETDILVEVNLDGSGSYEIETGIGFFDHMLTQISVHGLFDLIIKAKGDLQIDPHHTVEDCGLVLDEQLIVSAGLHVSEAKGCSQAIKGNYTSNPSHDLFNPQRDGRSEVLLEVREFPENWSLQVSRSLLRVDSTDS